ncbi:MAG: ATP adenylyltransferase family protein [Chloroflexota bacterium]
MKFERGTLWRRIVEVSDRGLREGTLLPIPTEQVFVEEGGVRFAVRVLSGLRRKAEERKRQDADEAVGKTVNPFLPYDQDLFVAEVSDTHVALLNKFNVVKHHLLVVTLHYEDQEALLTGADFLALWRCMVEYQCLGFYNGGREAGASQSHKHLQVVPLPLADEGPDVPVAPLLPAAVTVPDGIGAVPDFHFRHAFVRLDPGITASPERAAEETFGLYGRMLRRLGMRPPEEGTGVRQSGPYCLLVTRTWMLLVPRSREHFEDVSLNSLAFAGSFFVTSEEQLERIRAHGPLSVLMSVTVAEGGT